MPLGRSGFSVQQLENSYSRATNLLQRIHFALAIGTPANLGLVSRSGMGIGIISTPKIASLHHRYDIAAVSGRTNSTVELWAVSAPFATSMMSIIIG
jgi:hypothetical protein